jgi:hypothetical protein
MAFSHYLYYGNYGRPRHKFTKSLWTLSKCLNRTKRLLDFIRMWQRFEIFDNYAAIFLQHCAQRYFHSTPHHRLGLIGNYFSVSTDVLKSRFRQRFNYLFFLNKKQDWSIFTHPCIDTNQCSNVFFLNFFAYTSMPHYSEDSKKNLTVELVILCKNWLILSDANNSFVPHPYSQRNCTKTLISLCFGPTGISQLCDQLENIGWTSSVMSLKKILAKIFAKNSGRVSSVMRSSQYFPTGHKVGKSQLDQNTDWLKFSCSFSVSKDVAQKSCWHQTILINFYTKSQVQQLSSF